MARKPDPLTSKRRRTETFRFEVADTSDAAAAMTEARLLRLRASSEDDRKVARAAEEEAQAKLDACYGTVTLQSLPPSVHLAFQQEFAERDAVRERERREIVKVAEDAGQDPPEPDPEPERVWSEDDVEVRLIAACDKDGRPAKVWADVLASDDWSIPERDELYALALKANSPKRQFDLGVLGKD
jgi:hypothetical protein